MDGKKEIGIFELSELFGITPSAVRKYEAKGIIQPERDSSNRYRKYSSWEVVKMVYARGLSQAGFSLNQASDMLEMEKTVDPVAQIEVLQEKLAREIIYKKRLIAYLDRQKKEYMVRYARKEKLQIEHIPTIYACELLSKDRIVDKSGVEERENLKAWIRALPFVSLYTVRTKEGVQSTYLGISDEDMRKYGLTELKPERIFSGKMCVTCELKYDRKETYMGKHVKEAMDMVREAGFDVEDICILWLHGYRQAKDTYINYIKAYFPISES